MKKQLDIVGLPQLDEVDLCDAGQILEAHSAANGIDCVNWANKYPAKPDVKFFIAHTSRNLFLKFTAEEHYLRAEVDKNLGPVANDSCAEFFVKSPECKEYFNFEFNCIGRINASHRETRNNPTRLTPEELAEIGVYSSCGTEPFAEKKGNFEWSLTVAIPLKLIGFEIKGDGDFLLGNFYKCAGKSSRPHYLSWSPIVSETPNFHLPDFFGKLNIK